MKISSFIIAMILVGMIISVMGLFMASIGDSTGVTTYQNSTIASFDKLNNLSNEAEDLKDDIADVHETTGILDVIGSLFSSGWTALKTTDTSFKVFSELVQTGTSEANLGAGADIIQRSLLLIVLIVIFIGIFLAAIMKWYI